MLRPAISCVPGHFHHLRENAPIPDNRAKLQDFIGRHNKLAFIEIGTGSRNQLVRAAMMNLAAQMQGPEYLIFNLPQDVVVEPELQDRAIPLADNLDATLGGRASFFN